MKLTEKCVILPYERYEMLLNASSKEATNTKTNTQDNTLQTGTGLDASTRSKVSASKVSPSKLSPSKASPSKLSTPKTATSNTITEQPMTQTQSPIQSSNPSPQSKPSTSTYTSLPPPGIPSNGRKRKLSFDTKSSKRNTWKDLWTSI